MRRSAKTTATPPSDAAPTKAARPRKPAVKKARRLGRPPGKTRDAQLGIILAVARKHFAERGYESATFKDIGLDAGMTRTALYSYFDTKAALYLATLKDIHNEFLPEFTKTMAECKTLRERFKRIVMSSCAAHARDSNITGFLFAMPLEMRRHPELVDVLREQNVVAYRAMAAIFEEARANGEIRSKANTVDLVAAFFGGAVGVGLLHYGAQAYSTQPPSLSKVMSVFVTMSEGRIFAPKPVPAASAT